MKICSSSLIRETHINATLRPSVTYETEKSDSTRWGEQVTHTGLVGVHDAAGPTEGNLTVSDKTGFPFSLATHFWDSTLKIHSHKHMPKAAHCSPVRNSKILETIRMPLHRTLQKKPTCPCSLFFF